MGYAVFLYQFFQQLIMRKGKSLLNAEPAKGYTILTCYGLFNDVITKNRKKKVG